MVRLTGFFAVALALFSDMAHSEPLGTAFTYQGELKQASQVANGEFDFEFQLYDVPNGGIAIALPAQVDDVQVVDGVFTVELDFGSGVFDGTQLWLQVGVREGALMGAYTTLSPRSKLTATPYAIYGLAHGGGESASSEFVDVSATTVTGFNHFYGMNQICESELPGTKVCELAELVSSLKTVPPGHASTKAWINSASAVEVFLDSNECHLQEPVTGFTYTASTSQPCSMVLTAETLNCNGWSTQASTARGIALFISSTLVRNSAEGCDSDLPVACCTQ